MDLLEGLTRALESMASVGFFLALSIGIVNGIIFAVLPGLSGSVGIALMIPFSFGMEPTHAMALFVGALAAQNFVGSITAILINLPGSAPSAATAFDGYPLARQGRAGFAIGISAAASFLGTLVGIVVLLALFPVMRSVILAFSFPELAMLGVLGLTAIALAARGAMLKGILSGLFGLLLSLVGFAPVGGDIRYVFGQVSLYDGISVLAVLIGLFAITEGVRLLGTNERVAQNIGRLKFGRRQVAEGVRYTVKQPGLLIRSSLLGTAIGILPAVGGTLASFLAYFQASKTVKNPRFGQGDPRGVLAPEAANDAKDAGAALPSLAFGIPGSSDWAIVLGAMVIHGVAPGPNLIRDSPDILWVAIIVIVISSFISSALGVLAGPSLIQITKIKPGILAPVVIVLAMVGAYGVEARPVDLVTATLAGLAGYVMRVIGMPAVPLILGLLLGPMIERAYLQTLTTFDGGISAFVTRPISLVLVLLTLGIIVWEIISSRRNRNRSPEVYAASVAAGAERSSVIVVASLGVIAVLAIFFGSGFKPSSSTFPILIGTLMIVLSAVYVAVALVPALRKRFGGVIADSGAMEYVADTVVFDDDDEGDGTVDRAEAAVAQALGRNLSDAPAPDAPHVPSNADDTLVRKPDPTTQSVPTGLPEAAIVVDPADSVKRRTRWSIILISLMCLGSLAIGIEFAVPISLVLLLRLVSRTSWRTTILVTAGTCLALYFLFVSVLKVDLVGGFLLSY